MKKLLNVCLVFFMLFSVKNATGQNLVLNPSFENINVSCSGFGGAGYTNLLTWDNPDPTDTCSTPDWFSTCLSGFFPTAAPNSWLGTQAPRTGQAYAGIITYDATTSSYREYVEGQLSSPLVAGQTYCVSFYISLADTVPFATDKMGVYFSNSFVTFPVSHCTSPVPLPYTPQLQYSGPVLTDEINWVLLSWNYVASGGETYFTIGNFFNNASTTTVNVGGSLLNPFAYYFIDDVSVTSGPCCIADIASVPPMCAGDPAITLSVGTSGGVFSGPGVNATTGVFDPAVAGAGTHTINYTLGCGSTGTITIVVNPCTLLTLCSGAGGTATVSGGVGPYQWQTSTTTTPCISGIGFCSGTPFTVAGPPVTTWTTFSTGPTATLPGTYPIQVIDANGSVGTIADAAAYAALPPCSSCPPLAPNISSQVNVTCFGASTGSFNVSTTGGATPWDYALMNGATTVATFINVSGVQSFVGLPAGTYTLNVLDDNGCPGSITITITQPAAPTTTANAGPTQSGCSTSFTMAGNTATVGTGSWTLVSGAGAITTPGSPTTTITSIGAGTNVFMWTISNPPCASTTDTVTIINTGGPTTATAGPGQTVCGSSATLAGNTPVAGTGAWTLVSGAGTITSPSSPTSGITGLGVGSNVFQWTISNPPCTPSTSTVTITGVASPTAAAAGPNQTLCSSSATLAGNTPTSGTGTWTLVSGAGTIASPSSPTSGVTGLSAGANVFMWTISNPPCTSSTSTVTITNTGGPGINTTAQTNVTCNGASTGAATVAGSGGSGSYTYSWSSGATGATSTGLTAGTYTVTVTDGGGCSSTSLVTITQPAAITGAVSTTPATCGISDGTASTTGAGGSGALTYLWSPGSATTSSISGIPSGVYSVTITDSLGCVYSASGSVGSVGGPSVNAGADVTIIAGGSTVLTATVTSGASYSWSPSATLSCDTCPTTIATPSETTTYTVTVTQNGCSSTDVVTIYVEIECGELFVPNVFSPNNDGQNDELKIYGNCITDLEFVIFDRWGEKVVEITDPAVSWDGRYQGKMMDASVLVYYLKAKVKGVEVEKHGNITLVK